MDKANDVGGQMTQVTKESLSARIAELESGTRSIKEDYQLEAYRMLFALLVEGYFDREKMERMSKQIFVAGI